MRQPNIGAALRDKIGEVRSACGGKPRCERHVASANMLSAGNLSQMPTEAGSGKAAALPRCGRGMLASSAAPTLNNPEPKHRPASGIRLTGGLSPFAWTAGAEAALVMVA